MPEATRTVKDGNGVNFSVVFWQDGDDWRPLHRPDVTFSLAESVKTQADASGGQVTFAADIRAIRILNLGPTDGVFTVNGISIPVPAYVGLETRVEGTPSPIVTVSGATNYHLHRLV